MNIWHHINGCFHAFTPCQLFSNCLWTPSQYSDEEVLGVQAPVEVIYLKIKKYSPARVQLLWDHFSKGGPKFTNGLCLQARPTLPPDDREAQRWQAGTGVRNRVDRWQGPKANKQQGCTSFLIFWLAGQPVVARTGNRISPPHPTWLRAGDSR